MKKLLFAALLFVFAGLFQSAAAFTPSNTGTGSEVKFVITPQKIWVLADETIYSLPIQIKDAKGKVVLEREFTAKCADWSLNLESLSAGTYTVHVKDKEMTRFTK